MTIEILSRADDFGCCEEANEAIIETVDAGLVRNVSVMAVGPALAHRLPDLLEIQERICLGFHATITSEWATWRWGPTLPPDSVPGLVRGDGTFFPTTQEIQEKGQLQHLVRELKSQLNRLRSLNLKPRYLDTHMNFFQLPGVSQVLQEFCAAEGLFYANTPEFAELPCSLHDAEAPPTPELLLQAARSMQARPVWILHPCKPGPASLLFYPERDSPSDTVALYREIEYRRLTDSRFVSSLLQHPGIKFVRYVTD